MDDHTHSKLVGIWEALGRPDPPDIPTEALISEGISDEDYHEWRLDIEADKLREKELRADAAEVERRDAELRARGMEPMPPRRSPEEVAAIEERERKNDELRRAREKRADEAEWEDEGGKN